MADRFKIIIDELSGGAHVLTVNRRLSRSILTRFEGAMVEAGASTWDSPVVMPFQSWVKNLRAESRPRKALLSDKRSYALWKKVLSRDRRLSGALLFPQGAARTAYKAYVLTKQYRLRLPADETYLTEEARAFRDWLGQYEKELRSLGFIDNTMLIDHVRGLIKQGGLSLPKRIVLAGFDEIKPGAGALLDSLQEAGCGVVYWPDRPGALSPAPPLEAGTPEIREYDDEVMEVRSCARWARRKAEAGRRTGIIVPKLERYRSLIIKEFSAELDPPSILPWEPSHDIFNISLGASLDTTPLVRSAIDIISLGTGNIPVETMTSILRSPYFMADEGERMAFASFEKDFRERVCGKVTLWGLKRAVDKKNISSLADFSKRLGLWIEALKEAGNQKKFPQYWAEHFDNFLKGIPWPPKNLALNSREFQALKAWHELLGEFAVLDDVAGRLTWSGAAAELRAMARETIHQPETASESLVQVMGLLESSGLDFDNLWILGAHGDALPEKPSPNPFIPIALQKKAGLPRSTPELALKFARSALRRILLCAPEAVASFPRMVEGKELKVSPLFAARGSYIREPAALPGHRLVDSVHASYAVEDLVDNHGPSLDSGERARLRGGTGIIKAQSACPFQAFATYRLGARPLFKAEYGLDAKERGTLAHEALKSFWREARDSERLFEAHGQGRLASLIREAVREAIDGFFRPGVSKKFLALEAERLQDLLKEWMEVELERKAFIVVELEEEHEMDIGGLTLRVRLDRVDKLISGQRIVIDYKTGDCSKNYWLPGRPREPQMPLYALGKGVNAIAFASLKRTEKPAFTGLAEEDGMLPGMKGIESDKKWRAKAGGVKNWQELRVRWKETLAALAHNFIRGEASVDPNSEAGGNDWPCKYCGLDILCRKAMLGFLSDNERDNGD